MRIIRGEEKVSRLSGGSIISIGNYDGVHLGHAALIDELKKRATEASAESTVVTFEPYPEEFFKPNNPSPRLTTFREKAELFRSKGVDRVVCLRFDERLAETTAEEFIERYLLGRYGIQHLVVGKDFRFGKARKGSIELLKKIAPIHQVGISVVSEVRIDGERVSSSRIRELLRKGNLAQAANLLGRRYSISGHDCYGDKRGRVWGFPTANICLRYDHVPVRGVFAVLVRGIGNQVLKGIANIGNRPTISGDKFLLETHCFNFDGNIYGRRIYVEFCHWIRNEKKFDKLEDLRKQITKDIRRAEDWFRDNLSE